MDAPHNSTWRWLIVAWWYATLALIVLVAGFNNDLAAQQETVTDSYGSGYREPTVCWSSTMEFYSPSAFPYYDMDGYYFDANPFTATRMLEGNTAMIMRSARGRTLTDVSGQKVWTDARVYVRCFVVRYMFGFISQPYAIVVREFGAVQDKAYACSSGGGYTGTELDADYDPYASGSFVAYDETADYSYNAAYLGDVDCSGSGSSGGSGGGSESSGPGGSTCYPEWIVVEISYDNGLTWSVYWAGYARVCS